MSILKHTSFRTLANDPTILSEWRRVAFVENFFDILTDIHCCKEKGHIGTKKTLAEVLYDKLTGHTHTHTCKKCRFQSCTNVFLAQLLTSLFSSVWYATPVSQTTRAPLKEHPKNCFFVRARGHLTLASTVRSCR